VSMELDIRSASACRADILNFGTELKLTFWGNRFQPFRFLKSKVAERPAVQTCAFLEQHHLHKNALLMSRAGIQHTLKELRNMHKMIQVHTEGSTRDVGAETKEQLAEVRRRFHEADRAYRRFRGRAQTFRDGLDFCWGVSFSARPPLEWIPQSYN
jgi:hypothetical protein